MTEFSARVVLNGRVTIPTETREIMNIQEGDLVVLIIKEVKKAE